jgi:predicted naringenin-chalcone synthase
MGIQRCRGFSTVTLPSEPQRGRFHRRTTMEPMDHQTSPSTTADQSLGRPAVASYRSGQVGDESVQLGAAYSKSVASIDHDMTRPMVFAGATAVPVHSIAQSDSAILAQSIGISRRWHDALPSLYKKSGVGRRGSVLLEQAEGELQSRQFFYTAASELHPLGPSTARRMEAYRTHAPPLLAQACEQTIDRSNLNRSQITHLVTVSCTGFSSPGIDHEIIDRLSLTSTVQRTHVGFMGCHGLINGLRIAGALAKSDPHAIVLVGAVELCSIHQQYSEDPQQLVANSLFADGAASYLVSSAQGVTTDVRSTPTWNLVSSFSYKLSDTSRHMSWHIGDHGFEMSLSPEVPGIIESELRGPMVRWLAENHFTLDEINAWAVHPGGPRILDAVQSALSLPLDGLSASRRVLRDYGNMSSPTVAFVLDQCAGADSSIESCVMLGFGPGLSIEAMLLDRSRAT